MQQRRYTVSIVRGEGLVAHFGDVMMYIADTSAAAAPLIAAVEEVSEMESPGAAIAERIAPIAFQSALAFGVVAPADGGLLVLLRGNVVAEVDAPGGVQQLSGSRALTWVDEIVPTGADFVVVGVGAATELVGGAQTDLRAGVVPGGGFVVEPVDDEQTQAAPVVGARSMVRLEPTLAMPSPATRTSPAVSSPSETRVSPAVSGPGAGPSETRVSPVVSGSGAGPSETRVSPVVSGSGAGPSETRVSAAVRWPAETRTSPVVPPAADTATARAASPAETTAGRTMGPSRAPTPHPVSPGQESADAVVLPSGGAFLVSDAGDTFPLDRQYVIGRDPQVAGAVRNNEATPIVVANDRRISRVHAYVSVQGDAVYVRDAATPGGTFIAPPGSQKWTQIGSTPTELKPGWSIQIGDEVYTYRSR